MKELLFRIYGGEITAKKLLLSFVLVLVMVLGIGPDFGWEPPPITPAAANPAPAHNNPVPALGVNWPDDDDADPYTTPVVPEEVQALLSSIPYYGDVSKCRMTAALAAGYAQLIADGIAGSISRDDMQFDFDKSESSVPFFWEGSNDVLMNQPYQTNRSNVILADLEANGVPYLYVFSSLVDSNSYSVYGWDDFHYRNYDLDEYFYYNNFDLTDIVSLAICYEAYTGRFSCRLYESDNGTVAWRKDGDFGPEEYFGKTCAFSTGMAHHLYYDWDVSAVTDEDSGKEVVRLKIYASTGDKVTDYPASTDYSELIDIANAAGPCQPVDMKTRNLPYAPFSEVESHPATLRQMLDVLNQCASMLSEREFSPVVVPELSGDQLMAQSMLKKLSELSANGVEPEAYLLDMDADGTPELIWYDDDIEDAVTGGGYRVFRWDGQKLYEHQFDYLDYYVDKKSYGYKIVKYRNEYALAFLDMTEDNMLCGFYFLDRTDELLQGIKQYLDLGEEKEEEEEIPEYYYLYNGKDINHDEYSRLCEERHFGDVSWSHVVREEFPDAKTELQKLLAR